MKQRSTVKIKTRPNVQKQIHKQYGYSLSYISLVCKGVHYNKNIIDAAIRLNKEFDMKVEQQQKEAEKYA